MFRTLYARLALSLFVLILIVGGASILAGIYSAQMYQQEVVQRLNLDLADHIAKEQVLINESDLEHQNLEILFHNLMVINPSVEFYLLDPTGKVLTFSAAPGEVKRESVSLAPIYQLLESRDQLPILGDDPRSTTRTKAFSVAEVHHNDALQGYVYAILGSEQAADVQSMLSQSYILRGTVIGLVGAILFAIVAGLVVIFILTKQLCRLSQAMVVYHNSDFSSPVTFSKNIEQSHDEIAQMEATFSAMASRISEQMTHLKESDRMRRELVANVSHDLRTPMATLQGYLETLVLKDDILDKEERLNYLATASKSAQRLGKLIIELFDLAKLDAQELEPESEVFSIAELAQDIALKFELRAKEKDVTLTSNIEPNTPDVYADIGLIERVLDNLISNALRYTPASGHINLSVEVNDSYVTLKVSDDGEGIDPKDLPHIFKRFYRNKKESESSGLGLAIASRIVKMHDSTLHVSSEPGHGATFWFSLPRYQQNLV